MLNIFKNFGKGILYVLVLPFLLIGLAVYGVVALFVFIYLAIKGLVLFFTGRSLYEDLPEDKEAKRRIALANGGSLEEEEPEEPQQEILNQEEKQDDINNDPFYIPQYLKEDMNYQEPVQTVNQESEVSPVEEVVSEPQMPQEETLINEEIPAKSSQNDSFLEISDDDDEDSDDSGIKIDYE